MATCDKAIAKSIESSCNVKKGIARKGKIISRADIIDTDLGNVPSNHTLSKITSSKAAYDIVAPGTTPFSGLLQSMNVGTYANDFAVDIPIVILNNNPDVVDIVEGLANGEYVIVLENKDGGDDSNSGKYQVYGWEIGLKASAATREPYGDNPGWNVTMHEEGASAAGIFLSEAGWKALDETPAPAEPAEPAEQ